MFAAVYEMAGFLTSTPSGTPGVSPVPRSPPHPGLAGVHPDFHLATPVFTPAKTAIRSHGVGMDDDYLNAKEMSGGKRKSPVEVENGTYFGMYTKPEADRNKEKQLSLNSKFPDSLAAHRLVRVVVSVRMRPNIYGNASCACTRLVNPTDEMDRDTDLENSDDDDDDEEDAASPRSASVVVLTNRQRRNGGPESKYHFDHVFSPAASQAEVYRTVASPLIDNIMVGINACVIAYGQTGAGKTHTVFGPSTDAVRVTAEDARELGVIPRAAHDIFERVERDKGRFEYKVYVTYMQVYLDGIYDLIGNGHRSGRTPSRKEGKDNLNKPLQTLKIREHNGKPYVEGLSVHRVTSAHQILALLQKGARKKVVAATTMNQGSSRSHAVFQVMVDKEDKHGGRGRMLSSKFTCVDLAGSERASKTHPTGVQLKETKSINKSLCALGNTIAALSDRGVAKNKNLFVPWRDSKLTHLLCDALSGNSCVSLVVNVAPEDKHCPETVNSLLFGTRAKKVTLNPAANENIDYKTMAKWLQTRLDETVDGLREERGRAKAREQEFRAKLEDAQGKNSETELLEVTLMEQIQVNQELSGQLETFYADDKRGSPRTEKAAKDVDQLQQDVERLVLGNDERDELNELREAMALFGQERERLIASHAKQRAEWVRKEKLVHDVQQLRQEVESLSLGDDEREELRELREAVTLFGEERERLLADHAEQRAEWERCLTEATHEATFLARTRGAAGEDELLSILEQERKSFWETMEDTNEKLAFLELEHSKVVQENMELRSKLSQHEDDTESSVKKIRAILKNRREFTDSPISLPKSPGSPGSPGSPSADFSSVVASLASRRESPSPKRITVKRTGSVYIS